MVTQVIDGKIFEVIYYGTDYEDAAAYGAKHHHPLEYFVTKGAGISSRLYELWAWALYVEEQPIHREDLE